MSARSRRPRVGRQPASTAPPVGAAPDTDTFDDLVRACRALAQDPGLDRSAETHRRVVLRARATLSSARPEDEHGPVDAL